MKLNLNDTIFYLVSKDQKLIEILYDLGFHEITKPGMLHTVGRFMTLKTGASLRKIDMKIIIDTLIQKGYEIEGE